MSMNDLEASAEDFVKEMLASKPPVSDIADVMSRHGVADQRGCRVVRPFPKQTISKNKSWSTFRDKFPGIKLSMLYL